ncbi:MAG: PilZ domain-containing protein, partial [Myxococcales bacterium]|nr:PilZ domain-containing protein [Myxococcales bacterium]
MKDRRRSARVMVRGDAVMHLTPGRLEGRCLDLSTGGLLVLGPARLRPEPGTRLEVDIHVEGEHLRVAAELLRSREVKAGRLLALRFVDPAPPVRARLHALVNGKLLRTIRSDGAVVLDLRALRAAAAARAAGEPAGASAREPSSPATRISETESELAARGERPRYAPVVFQGTWRDDELITQEFQAPEALRGGTVVAPPPEPVAETITPLDPAPTSSPAETTATFGPAPSVIATAVEPTALLELTPEASEPEAIEPEEDTLALRPEPLPAVEPPALLELTPEASDPAIPHEAPPRHLPPEDTLVAPSDPGPTEGTVVLQPAPAPDPEGTVVLDPTPPEPTLRYQLPPSTDGPFEPPTTT